jgi:hypothetical protein
MSHRAHVINSVNNLLFNKERTWHWPDRALAVPLRPTHRMLRDHLSLAPRPLPPPLALRAKLSGLVYRLEQGGRIEWDGIGYENTGAVLQSHIFPSFYFQKNISTGRMKKRT